ncbi:MAG: methyltransferase [Methanoregula sp.]|nr:MAG: methyltransferase [Methanoregula sp.]
MSSIDKVQDEYPEQFCSLLEAAYGEGFLSEGGGEAIDALFDGFGLENKRILDIGAGLGGPAAYLAGRHGAIVTGLEINRPMVDESNRRIPPELRHRLSFVYYDDISRLPFPDASFDLAFCKGVLLHLDTGEKNILFGEIFRVLLPGGSFIISDWLSPEHGRWGERMKTIARADNLTIAANTEDDYREVIRTAGLTLVSIGDDNARYARYNENVADTIDDPATRKRLAPLFSPEYIDRQIWEYRLLAEAIREREMLVRKIVCHRPK